MLRPLKYILLFIVASQTPARADIGVPMIFVTLPYMVIALLPIILVESAAFARKLGVAPKSVMKAVSIANLVSTLIGIPVTWFILVLIQMFTGGGDAFGINTALKRFLAVTWQAPWLIPYEPDLRWMIPSATLVLLVPFFFASWLIEARVARRFLPEIPADNVRRGMLAANGASYLILGALVVVWLAAAR